MEDGFGADFSRVRVHTDGAANDVNRRIQAHAFTTGSDIFCGKGRYAPSSLGGQELLAHELAHVVQQGAAAVHPSRIQRNMGCEAEPSVPSYDSPPADPRKLTAGPDSRGLDSRTLTRGSSDGVGAAIDDRCDSCEPHAGISSVAEACSAIHLDACTCRQPGGRRALETRGGSCRRRDRRYARELGGNRSKSASGRESCRIPRRFPPR